MEESKVESQMISNILYTKGKRRSYTKPADVICELNKRPRHAVCCKVLNLPKQDGHLHRCAALAEAYRVARVIMVPFFKVLAQNRCYNITNTAG